MKGALMKKEIYRGPPSNKKPEPVEPGNYDPAIQAEGFGVKIINPYLEPDPKKINELGS